MDNVAARGPSSSQAIRQQLRVLLVEDSEDDAALLLHELERGGVDVVHERVEGRDDFEAALRASTWDIIVCDYSLPTFDALRAIDSLRATGLDIPLIVLSGTIDEDTATGALRAGARDFVVKGRLSRLLPAIEREVRESRSRALLRCTEERFRHAQRLDAVGQVAAGFAHDLNNLLAVIMMNGEVLAEVGNPQLDVAQDILDASRRAVALTRQLLTFARQQPVTLQTANMNDVVRGIESMVRRIVGNAISVEIVAALDLGTVEIDVGQMEQVLMNLVVNARDAMPRGGRLVIETANADLVAPAESNLATPAPHVLISAKDDGVGMDAATRARIFDPFFSTKERGAGTGLGLSTVFGIVRQLRGHIVVDSAPGAGSTFRIYLPRTDRR